MSSLLFVYDPVKSRAWLMHNRMDLRTWELRQLHFKPCRAMRRLTLGAPK